MRGIHHVYARGSVRQRLFRDDDDRREYLAALARVTVRMRWRLLAYCLLVNHVHVVVETREPNLGEGLRRLHAAYARAFDERLRHTGHVFEGRFGARPVEPGPRLRSTLAYVALDPVTSGLCAVPEQYPWSSHALVVKERAPLWLDERRLLEHFDAGRGGGDPRRLYAELIEGSGSVVAL